MVSVSELLLILLVWLAALPALAGQSTPAAVKTVYILPSSHWDLGFLRTPADERAAIKPHLDAVVRACGRDRGFRWTIESIWQIEAWKERTPDPAARRALRACIRSGQIDVSAAWGSMHTEWMSTELLDRQMDAAQTLAREFGFRTDFVMENDTPGFSLRLPQTFRQAGVRYFLTGSNTFIGGGTTLSPGQVPFRWRGPDGSEVLTWQTQGRDGGYTEGLADYPLDPGARDPYKGTPFYPKEWAGLPPGEITARAVDKLVRHYADAGFRGKSVALMYMHDGVGPELEQSLLPIVRRWNREGRRPRLAVATPHEFFAALAKAGPYPVQAGDWSSLWPASKTDSPAMSADARLTEERLPMAETAAGLASLLRGMEYPAAPLVQAEAALEQYDEHNGAGSAGWPKVLTEAQVNESNLEYADGVRGARSAVDSALALALPLLTGSQATGEPGRVLTVANLRSRPESGLVRFRSAQPVAALEDRVTHALLPVEPTAPGEWEFAARMVPAFGYRSYLVRFGTAPQASAGAQTGAVATAQNERYRVEVERRTGELQRVVDMRNGRELLGAVQVLRNGEPAAAGSMTVTESTGAVEERITVDRPGSWRARTVVTLPRGLDSVILEEQWDRARMPPSPGGKPADHYAVRFPVERGAQRWVDDGLGFHRLPEDLLPGARQDGAVPRWTLALEGSAQTLLLAQRESFFLHFPTDGGSVEALALSKTDEGETRDHGIVRFADYEPGYGGQYRFRFALRAVEGGLDPVEAYRFGREEAVSMPAALLEPGEVPEQAERSFLGCDAPGVAILAFRPSRTGAPGTYVLRLQEIAGRAASGFALTLPARPLHAERTDITETRPLGPIDLRNVSLRPHESATVRVRLAPAQAYREFGKAK